MKVTVEFLRSKGIISEDSSDMMINFTDEEVSLVEILEEYHQFLVEEHRVDIANSAMTGILAGGDGKIKPSKAASKAVRCADALIEELKKRT